MMLTLVYRIELFYSRRNINEGAFTFRIEVHLGQHRHKNGQLTGEKVCIHTFKVHNRSKQQNC